MKRTLWCRLGIFAVGTVLCIGTGLGLGCGGKEAAVVRPDQSTMTKEQRENQQRQMEKLQQSLGTPKQQ